MKPSRTNFWVRFGVFFWVFTIAYWIVAVGGGAFYAGLPSDSSTGGIPSAVGSVPGNILGLFVPVGPSNIWLFIIGLFSGHLNAWGASILLFLVLYYAERLLRKLNLGIVLKVLANLLILFLLTLSVDYLLLGKWASYGVLKDSINYTNDQYGANTPEGTVADFRQALESSDTQTAVKYFELDKQKNAQDFFAHLAATSTPEMLAGDLGKLTVRSASEQDVAYILRDSYQKVIVGMFLHKNSKDMWKISYLLFNGQDTQI